MPENNEFMARLKEFRDTHKQKTLIKDNVEWKYYSSGNGEAAILMLVGGLGVGEAAFLHILELEKSYRVIVPSFPPVPTISELVDGIIEILDRETIENFSIIGQSLGGILAQELLRRCKARVRKVVFSHTTTITPSIDKQQLRMEKEKLRKLIRIIKIMPLWVMKKLFKQRLHKHFI
jgi:pimeloyl-ACP methyl ester carboxylesterase